MLRLTKKRKVLDSQVIEEDETDQTFDENIKEVSTKATKKLKKDQQIDDNLESLIYNGIVTDDEDDEKDTDAVEDKRIEAEEESLWSDDDDDDNDEERKEKFEKLMGPVPEWAKPKTDDHDNVLDDFNTELLSSKQKYLSHTNLKIVKCVDANKQERSKAKLEACEFHKTSRIILTASQDHRLNLFQVDGKNNAKIHSIFMENYPIRCAHFLSNGSEIMMSSHLPWMFTYDMLSGKVTRNCCIKGLDHQSMKSFKVSPNGKHLVFLSSYGKMHVACQTSKELIKTLKMNGSVEDVAFFNDGDSMLSYGDDGVVYTWDMNTLQCVSTFSNQISTNGTTIDCTSNGKYFACGSDSGYVDVFQSEASEPVLQKSYKNILTPLSCLKFNNSGEILAMASNMANCAIKLANTSHSSVYSNFPTFTDKKLEKVRLIDFSPNDGYMLLGNGTGRALLYRLNHYSSY